LIHSTSASPNHAYAFICSLIHFFTCHSFHHVHDEAKIRVKAGDAANGCMAFRREKFVPRAALRGDALAAT